MGKGIDLALAAEASPEFKQALEDLRDQALIVLVKRYVTERTTIPVAEMDDTSNDLLKIEMDPTTRAFTFKVTRKQ